jgi:hypothetical protein
LAGRWIRRGAAAAALTVIATIGTTQAMAATAPAPNPATSATPATPTAPGTGTATGTATTVPSPEPEHTLSPAELAAQITAANKLTDELNSSNAQLAGASARLSRLAAQANTLLQEYAEARDVEREARTAANKHIARYQELENQMVTDRQMLGRWAYQAYTGGGSFADMAAVIDSLADDPAAATDNFAQLAYLSEQRAEAFERVQDHTAQQREVTAKAVSESRRAAEAARAAGRAKADLDEVIKKQQQELEATRTLHAAQVAKAGPVSGLLLGSEDSVAVAAAKALRDAAKLPELLADSENACDSDDREYPNGHVPASGLCPLYKAPGESLRPAAAAAFNALSKAYERDTGSPICITDSYRSYPEQVSVKASRGRWAATPGTSEHGYGRALDLCGGINDFGSPAHLWMKQNAPLYGWFHPDWAAAGGSLPEPWHWEFAG